MGPSAVLLEPNDLRESLRSDDKDTTCTTRTTRTTMYDGDALKAHPPPLPSFPQHTIPDPPSRALQACACETTTTRQDASWRLVAVTLPAAAFRPPPSADHLGPTVSRNRGPAVSRAATRARETTTTRRDASRRLVSSSLSPPPPPHTAAILSGPPRARRLARSEPVHARRRRRRDETPDGVSSLSLLCPRRRCRCLLPSSTLSGPPRARRLARYMP
ncbi:hypothetical protein PLICRDRAFT_180619, partial [Plicaturopsis crispa FD-325 SS-3]